MELLRPRCLRTGGLQMRRRWHADEFVLQNVVPACCIPPRESPDLRDNCIILAQLIKKQADLNRGVGVWMDRGLNGLLRGSGGRQMIELEKAEFFRVRPLLTGIRQKVLPHAICAGINPGRILVDRYEDPRLALIWSTVGYYCLAGSPGPEHDLAEVRRVLTDVFIPASRAGGEEGFILIPSDDAWKLYFPALLPPGRVIEIYRRPFAFHPAEFAAQGSWRERIAPGFCLAPMDAALAERVGVQGSWASAADFLQNGLGFVVLAGAEIASSCFSVLASPEQIEVDVHTAADYRRRGLARWAASALIEECLRRGKQPNWECFLENAPSAALAGCLGFHAEPEYPVFVWEG